MIKPLSQILNDGSLVDNMVHQAREGVFARAHWARQWKFGRGGERIILGRTGPCFKKQRR